MTTPIDVTPQCVIVARLADFCRYNSAVSSYERDPWHYMRSKLRELEQPTADLKRAQLASTCRRFLEHLKSPGAGERELADFKEVLDGCLSPGDFVDIAFNLTPEDLSDPPRRERLAKLLGGLRPYSLFDEERKPEEGRSRRHQKLISELTTRLGLDVCERVLARKTRKPSPRRKRWVLRRIRREVAEYCSVLHLPISPDDTFSPFMLPRVEALVIACLRVLDRWR